MAERAQRQTGQESETEVSPNAVACFARPVCPRARRPAQEEVEDAGAVAENQHPAHVVGPQAVREHEQPVDEQNNTATAPHTGLMRSDPSRNT